MNRLLVKNILRSSLVQRTSNYQQVAYFARAKPGFKRPVKKNETTTTLATTPPPPSDATNIQDCWVPVQDKASGQIYYWNTVTNETTALGQPKPTGPSSGLANYQQAAPTQSLGSVMAEGMAWGAGSAVAHRAVGSLFGGGGHNSAEGHVDDTVDTSDSWDV